jgi:hypothetical protein
LEAIFVQYRKITTVALVLILVMIILEIYGVSKMLFLLFALSGATSLSYSILVRATDPFIFMESIAYVLLSAALLLMAYPILSGSFRKALWIVYPVAYLIFLAESFTQMTALNSMYYQAVTMNNIGVYTSVSDGLDIGASLFMLIWAIMFFITYLSARKIFPKFKPPMVCLTKASLNPIRTPLQIYLLEDRHLAAKLPALIAGH